MAENKLNFEESLSALENVVEKLESGECTLEESIALFEKGMKNITECRDALKTAEKKIITLSQLEGESENA